MRRFELLLNLLILTLQLGLRRIIVLMHQFFKHLLLLSTLSSHFLVQILPVLIAFVGVALYCRIAHDSCLWRCNVSI